LRLLHFDGLPVATFDYIDILRGRFDTRFGFFPGSMQNIELLSDLNRIHYAVRIGLKTNGNLKKPLPTPLNGLAEGTFSPLCASYSADPMLLRTSGGKLLTCLRESPS